MVPQHVFPVIVLISLLAAAAPVQSQEQSAGEENTESESKEMFSFLPKVNLVAPTLGGRQFWGDVLFFRGYRIQHLVESDHYRLLDPNDFRLAWGTEEDCRNALETVKREQGLAPMSGRAVILLHGIIRSSKSFSTLSRKLEKTGVTVIGFDYPSTRVPITESADYFKRVLASLEGIDQIDLVVHSMGGLLVRTYLREEGGARDPRLHRMVMLGVPNCGAKLANLLQKNWLFQQVLGPAGQQLKEGAEEYIASLPVPDFEFAVVAGARGTPDGWNPLVPGDDDGTVSVESTKLTGARDFMTVYSLHTAIMWNSEAVGAVVRFLETGVFRESGERTELVEIGEQ